MHKIKASATVAKVATVAALVAALAGCAGVGPTPNYDALMGEMMKASFRDQGIAKVERLQQDASNAECSAAQGKALPESRSKVIEAANLASVKMPADGKFIEIGRAHV